MARILNKQILNNTSNTALSKVIIFSGPNPGNIYLFKVNNKSIRKRCEIFSRLTIKTPERRHCHSSAAFIVNFEHISNFLWYFYCYFEQVSVSWDLSN